MKIVNFQDFETYSHAEVWCAKPIVVLQNKNWWPKDRDLLSEKKGDVWRIGCIDKIDVIDRCFLVRHGKDKRGYLFDTQHVADEKFLDNPPTVNHLPIYPGVNVIELDAEPTPPTPPQPPPPEPEPPPTPEPEPEPEPPTPDVPDVDIKLPRTFTIYGSTRTSHPFFCLWSSVDLVFVVPMDWYLEAWESGPKKLIERLGMKD